MTTTGRRVAVVTLACKSGDAAVHGFLSEPGGFWAVTPDALGTAPLRLDMDAWNVTHIASGFRFPTWVRDRDALLDFADRLDAELDCSALRREGNEIVGVTDEMIAKAAELRAEMQEVYANAP